MVGGGRNHRYNLTDAAMLKDNHIDAYGGITPAVKPGSISAFAVLNDEERAVTVVFDRDLVGEKNFALHPNENTATIYIDFSDVENIVKSHGNEIIYAKV